MAMIVLAVGPFFAGIVAPIVIVDQWFRHVNPRSRPQHSFLVILAFMSFELTEGLRLGLEQHVDRLREQFKVIMITKIVKSFMLGLALAWYNRDRGGRNVAVECVALFAAITPLGMAIGMGLGLPLVRDIVNELTDPTVWMVRSMGTLTLVYVLLVDLGGAQRPAAR